MTYADAPRLKRGLHELGVRGGREHHDLHGGVPRAQLIETGEPVHVRHADVEKHEVGIGLRDERKHLRARLRLAHDLEVAVRLERTLDPVEDEAMVVGDHDAHADQCRTGL